MTAVLFVGPSFPALHRLALPGITVRPPAAQGDVLRALGHGARAIGLVDGVFGHEPAVWHKEILAALEAGIPVWGAASMGALRAAELHPFGMEGVGTIFAAYRDGILVADDEVALLHGPAELGWPAVSEPLVNLRATLARLAAAGLVSEREARAVADELARRFYPQRSWGLLEDLLRAEVGPARAEAVVPASRRLRVDAKRIDAARLVRRLRTWLEAGAPPARPRFVLARSRPFTKLAAALGLSAVVGRWPGRPSVTTRLAALPPRPARAWTLLTLAAADNDLACELRADLGELLTARELGRLHVAGELDSRDPELCGRFAILVEERPDAAGREVRLVIEPRGPRNTGDPALLRELLRWGLPTFPAARRALVFWGHGEGIRLAIDDGAAGSLSVPRLLEALEGGSPGFAPLDLVVFDACLMAKLELLADLAPFVRFVVASGELVPATGMPYHDVAALLAGNRCAAAAAVALVEAFLDDAAAREQRHARLVAARTDGAAQAMAALGAVGERLCALLPEARSAIAEARLLARTPRTGELVDVVDLLDRLARRLADPILRDRSARAVAAVERCILASRGLWPRRGPVRGGINVWFPTRTARFLAGRADYARRPALRGPGASWLHWLDRWHAAET